MIFKERKGDFCNGQEGMCWEPTGVLNKLCVWVWHSPKLQKGANIVVPRTVHAWIGIASAAEVGKMQYSCFSFNVYVQREAVTGSSYSRGLQCQPPPLRNASPPCVATVYNEFTGGRDDWCVSIRAPSVPGPSFMYVWSSVCLFWHLPLPLVQVSRTTSCRTWE
jgi:hypothetical protein